MKCESFLFHQSHTTNSKINWLAAFVSEFCFSKITLLLEVISGFSQSWIKTHFLHSHQEGGKVLLPHFSLTTSPACRLWRCPAFIKGDSVNMSFPERDFSLKFQWAQKLRDFGSITAYWYLYSSPLFHISSGHLRKYSLPSGFVPPHCEIQSSPITLIGLDSTIKCFSPKDDRGFDNLIRYLNKSAETD